MSVTPIIQTTGLTYQYSKAVKTLSDINLLIEKGSIYGFLGPNGSGKTTTLSLLLGLLKTQEGRIEIFGQTLEQHRINILKRVGSLIETPSLYAHLTARENLDVYRRLYGVNKNRVNEVLRIVGLTATRNKTVKKFSLGMKQRLALALALLPQPELLILDEPSNGLDPSGIVELRELLKKLNREEGLTILISSHLLSEVEKMISHVGIISQGKLLFQGRMQDLLLLQQKGGRLLLQTSDNDAAFQLLRQYAPERMETGLTFPLNGTTQAAEVARILVSNDISLYRLQPEEADLEHLFIQLTGKSLS